VADFSTIRAGLADALLAIPGLQVERTAPETVTPPVVVITPGEGEFLTFDVDMDDHDDLLWTLHLFVPRRLDVVGQTELDGYLDRTGPTSIYAALNGVSIAGVAFANVVDATEYGDYTYAAEPCLGCKFTVKVGT
jgi:hypothetical protein